MSLTAHSSVTEQQKTKFREMLLDTSQTTSIGFQSLRSTVPRIQTLTSFKIACKPRKPS